jgi:hypothetical protein
MLSSRFIRLIEDHWDQITERVIRQIHRDSNLYEIGRLSESDLRVRSREILENLGTRLTTPKDELIRCQEEFGRKRFEDGIPLHEVVHALHIIKEKMIEFVRDQGMGRTSLDLYAEEEFEHNVSRLIDTLVYCVVRGYERAMKDAALKVATVNTARTRGEA